MATKIYIHACDSIDALHAKIPEMNDNVRSKHETIIWDISESFRMSMQCEIDKSMGTHASHSALSRNKKNVE